MQKQILLATYNGEKYLHEQLESLLAQTDQDWTLLVRDDASTDKTPEILKDFAVAHPDKVVIVHDYADGRSNENIGSKRNFSRLLELSTAPYIMFCDQDDVWYPEKIAKSMKKMHEMEKQYGKKEPLLVHTDYQVTDSAGKIRGDSGKRPHTKFHQLALENDVTGFTILINREMAKEIQPIPDVIHHDSWGGVIAALKGYIGYVNEPLAGYRRHEDNVTGDRYHADPFAARIRKKIRDGITRSYDAMVEENTSYYHDRTVLPECLLRGRGHDMGEAEYRAVKALADLPQQGYFQQRVSMIQHDLLPRRGIEQRVHRLLLPVKSRKSSDVGAREWGEIIEQTDPVAGIISSALCNQNTSSLIHWLGDNRSDGAAVDCFTDLLHDSKKVMQQVSGQDKIDVVLFSDLLVVGLKKFVQKASASKGNLGGTQWEDLTLDADFKAVHDELLNSWIRPEIEGYFKNKKNDISVSR